VLLSVYLQSVIDVRVVHDARVSEFIRQSSDIRDSVALGQVVVRIVVEVAAYARHVSAVRRRNVDVDSRQAVELDREAERRLEANEETRVVDGVVGHAVWYADWDTVHLRMHMHGSVLLSSPQKQVNIKFESHLADRSTSSGPKIT